ncbi:MAG TPA: ubiquitin-like domain-containing protein [Actinomycetales bacterium]|nr:ubiquitin-like domain-containing protein [Actinomycetales bacterium]
MSKVMRRTAQTAILGLLVAGISGWSMLHKDITLEIDGEQTRIDTFASSVDHVLAGAGVEVSPEDLVAPALGSEIADGATIVVRSAAPLDVVIDGKTETILTSAETVDELLSSLGPRGENALVTSSRSARMDRADSAATPLHVSTEKTARVSVDGNVVEGRTAAMTVGEMLTEWGIFLSENDSSSVPLSSPTVDGMVVMVNRHTVEGGTETTTLPFETVEVENDELMKGTKRTVTKGKTGSRVVTYKSIMVDGEEVDREILTEAVVSDPVDEVVHIGTKPEPEIPEAEPAPEVKPGSNRELGREMAADRGWGDDQFRCLDNLWTRESNWRHTAANSSSGAYGIPQALPGSKMGSVGSDWRTNPATQIPWGLNYIKGRYGTPCGAWNFFQNRNWY